MTPASLLRRHPLLGYFALCFGTSWGGILIMPAVTRFNLTALRPPETSLVFALMLSDAGRFR